MYERDVKRVGKVYENVGACRERVINCRKLVGKGQVVGVKMVGTVRKWYENGRKILGKGGNRA